jgi:hypothetical protein
MNALTHNRDGRERNPSIVAVLKHFRFDHLPERLRDISKDCHDLAIKMADQLPENPDLTVGLRELLAAKDNFVRANV